MLIICFKLYNNRDVNIHNTASVTIRQIVQNLFDRLSQLAEKGRGSQYTIITIIIIIF